MRYILNEDLISRYYGVFTRKHSRQEIEIESANQLFHDLCIETTQGVALILRV